MFQRQLRLATFTPGGWCAVVALFTLWVGGCAPAMPANRVTGTWVDLHADLPPQGGAALAAEADGFLAAVSTRLGAKPPSPTVYVFDTDWDLWLYLRRHCPAFSCRAGACFQAEDGRLIVAVRAADDGRPDPARLRHELTHAVIGSAFAEPMPWLDEGIAQVFESGCPPTGDLARMAALRALPHLELRVVRVAALSRHEDLDDDDHVVAWGLAWFLFEDVAHGRTAVAACLEPPVVGEGASERFSRCLGASPAEMGRRLAEFVAAPR